MNALVLMILSGHLLLLSVFCGENATQGTERSDHFPNHTAVPGRAGIHLLQAGSKSRLSAKSLAPTQTLLNGM